MLIDAVRAGLSEGATGYNHPQDRHLPEYERHLRLRRVTGAPISLRSLIQVLRRDPELGAFARSWVPGPMGSSRRRPSNLRTVAHWLLAQATLRSPELVVEDLYQAVRRNSLDAIEVEALANVQPERTLDLAPNLRILRFDDLPDTHVTREMKAPKWEDRPMMALYPFSALVGNVTVRPYLAEMAEEPVVSDKPLFAAALVFMTAQLLLAPVSFAAWRRPAIPAPYANYISGNVSYFRHDVLWGHPYSVSVIRDEKQQSQHFIELFGKLQDPVKSMIVIATERLNTAIRRSAYVDKVIDLCIALESLLLSGTDQKTEIVFRLSLRGACLLGSSPAKRVEIFELLRALYELRSSSVHSGRLKEKVTAKVSPQLKKNPTGIIHIGIQMCAMVILSIVCKGAIPDWSLIFGLD